MHILVYFDTRAYKVYAGAVIAIHEGQQSWPLCK